MYTLELIILIDYLPVSLRLHIYGLYLLFVSFDYLIDEKMSSKL